VIIQQNMILNAESFATWRKENTNEW